MKQRTKDKVINGDSIFFTDEEDPRTFSLSNQFAEHMEFELVKDKITATGDDAYFSLSLAVRDRLVRRWLRTQNQYYEKDVKRVYYLYDVPGGSERGAHGHKCLAQFMVAMSGSFDVTLDDGNMKHKYHLNRSYYGLYIPPMTWRELDNFSTGAVSMVLASEVYEEEDYIRDYDEFLSVVRSCSK